MSQWYGIGLEEFRILHGAEAVRFSQRVCEHAMVNADGSCMFCNAPRAEVISAITRRTERR